MSMFRQPCLFIANTKFKIFETSIAKYQQHLGKLVSRDKCVTYMEGQ